MASDDDRHDAALDRLLRSYYEKKKRAARAECPAVDELLAYIDGGLAEERKSVVHRHLPHCAACRDTVLALKLPLAEPDDGPPSLREFKQRLPDDLRPTRPPARGWRRWLAALAPGRRPLWLPAAGLIGAALLLAVWLHLYPSEQSRLSYVEKETWSHVLRGHPATGQAGDYKQAFRLGLTRLGESQFWRLTRVDAAKVNEAIQHLEDAKRWAGDAGDAGYVTECAFFLGKAYLKKNDWPQARTAFTEFLERADASSAFLKRRQEAEDALNFIDRRARPPK